MYIYICIGEGVKKPLVADLSEREGGGFKGGKDAECSKHKDMYLEGFQVILNVFPQNHTFRPF